MDDDRRRCALEKRAMLLELNRNESRILYARMTGILTFQGFLFAAVGIAAGRGLWGLAALIAIVGGLVCVSWRTGVRVSFMGAEALGRDVKAINEALPENARFPGLDAIDVKPSDFRLLPEVILPFGVAVTWIVIAVYTLIQLCRGS